MGSRDTMMDNIYIHIVSSLIEANFNDEFKQQGSNILYSIGYFGYDKQEMECHGEKNDNNLMVMKIKSLD